MGKKNKANVFKKAIGVIFILIIAAMAYCGYFYYRILFAANILAEQEEAAYFHIPTASTLNDVVVKLHDKGFIKDTMTFIMVSEWMNYDNRVLSGRYLLQPGMNNIEAVRLLRSGVQAPVRVMINQEKTLEEIASTFSRVLEADSTELIGMLNDPLVLKANGVNEYTILSLFLPDTYEFYWNTSAQGVIDRMKKEYDRFWTKTRKQKAENLELTLVEVVILASIVQEESYRTEEWRRIAGVYLNRLNRNMRLQADPTVRFAVNDTSVKRILNAHLRIISPYNTYIHTGLPPGPIALTRASAIDAVLNAENHNYMYFCAKDDLSGFHQFSVSYREHQECARRYRQLMDRLGIR